MDQNQQGQGVNHPTQAARGKNKYEFNPMVGPSNPPTQIVGPSNLSPHPRDAPEYTNQLQQDVLQQQLNNFWAKQCQEIGEATNFKTPNMPLSRIRKIMKADEDVRMISAETPMVFAKACEMFIQELTIRAWANAEENKKKTLQKSDIASAITKNDMFDFLVDIFPRDDKLEHADIPRRGTAPIENVPYYYYMSPHQYVARPPHGAPGMVMGRPIPDQNQNGLQTRPFFPTPMRPTSDE
ncbi:nuclear transcription factor Y subunit C-2 [Cajanus cajan]|uniref:nuclear transcription factor Y subunit C-2 n=1 Tax=Cajanus cajan TaxID=3821 RepID=UPI00098DA0E9|nr:nuclear transcription factor Y subunit C-2 [Cajanus cajan]XP_020210453.1 nuclear transcription factor Y subunit C-2 [Cajanus cajan]XP_029128497.1 nuclear transcription factor Y subunit C-2 [Cajanus cajan]